MVKHKKFKPGSKVDFNWSENSQSAFEKAKKNLITTLTLAYPSPDAPYSLTRDASGIAVGAVLHQLIDGNWKPLGFFTKKIGPTESLATRLPVRNHNQTPINRPAKISHRRQPVILDQHVSPTVIKGRLPKKRIVVAVTASTRNSYMAVRALIETYNNNNISYL